jgi:hypothetical protein
VRCGAVPCQQRRQRRPGLLGGGRKCPRCSDPDSRARSARWSVRRGPARARRDARRAARSARSSRWARRPAPPPSRRLLLPAHGLGETRFAGRDFPYSSKWGDGANRFKRPRAITSSVAITAPTPTARARPVKPLGPLDHGRRPVEETARSRGLAVQRCERLVERASARVKARAERPERAFQFQLLPSESEFQSQDLS